MMLILGSIASYSMNVSAYSVQKSEEAVPLAEDEIIIKIRVLPDGTRQYRRWNETKKCWVDPYWINM